MNNPNKLLSSSYAILAITFWGISFVSTKTLLQKIDIYSLVSLRFGIASLFLFFLLLLLRHPISIKQAIIPNLFILAIVGVFIHQLIQATALLSIEASSAGWIISFTPIFTALLSFFFLSERFTFSRLIGITISVFGVLLITSHKTGGTIQFSANLGYLFMIASALNWAVYSILLKSFRLTYSPLVITFWTSFIGFLMTVPLFIRNEGHTVLTILSPYEWVHLLFLGIFVSGIAYWYWSKALEVLEATQVSVFMYLQPMVTATFAMLLLKEQLVYSTIIGGILIIIGVTTLNKHFIIFFRKGNTFFRK
ncbi:DMT family transporter [Bacillus timonensis]|nr:DMT family transporter [Bacillus timonensis]